MGDTTLDKTFNFILKRLVKTGQAPFYPEIANELGSSKDFSGDSCCFSFSPGVCYYINK